MFRGTHLTRLDDKGRFKMPAEFKRVIDENYSAQFYITSWDGKSAKVYPMQAWEEIERKLAALPEMHKTKQKFLERTSYYGQVVDFDGQGRLLMPQILRETANLEGRGCGDGQLEAPGGAQCRRAPQGGGGTFHRGR